MNKFIENMKKKIIIIIIRHPRLTPGAMIGAFQVSGFRARFRRFWKSLGLGDSR